MTQPKIVAGIDYSYTSPAICVMNRDLPHEFKHIKFYNLQDKKSLYGEYGENKNVHIDLLTAKDWLSQEERFTKIFAWSSSILERLGVEEVCIEGYAMGSTRGFVFDIAENTGLLKNWMYKRGIAFHKPSPGTVKKNYTGKGNAKKEPMIDEFDKRMGIHIHEILGTKQYAKPTDDIADSHAVLMTHPCFQS